MTTALILLSEFQKSQIEFWLPIKGYPGYDVSSLGRVRSCLKNWGRGHRSINEKLLKPLPVSKYRMVKTMSPGKVADNDYIGLTLFRDGKAKRFHVHQLVARAFISNPSGQGEVNHKNGIKYDPRSENLEWVTRSVNHQHAMRYGLQKYSTKLTKADVLTVWAELRRGTKQVEIAKMLGVDKCTISDIKFGRTWRHLNAQCYSSI